MTLRRELWWLWRNEKAFDEAARLLQYIGGALRRGGSAPGTGQGSGEVSAIAAGLASDGRILHVRVRQLVGNVREMHTPSASQLMEINREASGLDQEHMAGRFTLTRYILYLLPVIGFIGTVEGISKALMNISKVLPLVKDLDAFLNNLTGVTSALQIAFDSTLLALFLSAALMLVQTLVYRKSEALLARVDGWVVEHVLPGVGTKDPFAERLDELIGPHLEQLRSELATILAPAAQSLQVEAAKIGQNLKAPIAQLAASMDQLPRSMAAFQQGAEAIGRVGNELEVLETAGEAMRQGAATLVADRARPGSIGRTRSAARGHQARARPRNAGDREPVRLVVLGLREVEPHHPGAARQHDEQPQGRARADQREHRAGELAVPQHRQEDVRRAGRRALRRGPTRSVPPDGRARGGGYQVKLVGVVGEGCSMRRNRRGGGSGLEFGGSGEDSFVAVVVTKLTGALLFILLLTMVIMALLPKAVDLAPPGGDNGRESAEAEPVPLSITTPEALPEAIAGRPYAVALAAAGGRGALHWNIEGPLPEGLTFDAAVRSACRERRRKGRPSRCHWSMRVSDGTSIATGSARLLVYQSDKPLITPAWWKPGLPPVPWRAWLDHGVGFLVLWLIHLVGMSTLANLERTAVQATVALEGVDGGSLIVGRRYAIYRNLMRLSTLSGDAGAWRLALDSAVNWPA